MAKEKIETKHEEAVPKFTKEQLLKAKKYNDRVDAIRVVLPDDFNGSIAEADALLDKFMKGKVN